MITRAQRMITGSCDSAVMVGLSRTRKAGKCMLSFAFLELNLVSFEKNPRPRINRSAKLSAYSRRYSCLITDIHTLYYVSVYINEDAGSVYSISKQQLIDVALRARTRLTAELSHAASAFIPFPDPPPGEPPEWPLRQYYRLGAGMQFETSPCYGSNMGFRPLLEPASYHEVLTILAGVMALIQPWNEPRMGKHVGSVVFYKYGGKAEQPFQFWNTKLLGYIQWASMLAPFERPHVAKGIEAFCDAVVAPAVASNMTAS